MAADRTVSRAAYLCIAAFGVNVLNCRDEVYRITVCMVGVPRLRMRTSEPRDRPSCTLATSVHQADIDYVTWSSRRGNPHAYPPFGAHGDLFSMMFAVAHDRFSELGAITDRVAGRRILADDVTDSVKKAGSAKVGHDQPGTWTRWARRIAVLAWKVPGRAPTARTRLRAMAHRVSQAASAWNRRTAGGPGRLPRASLRGHHRPADSDSVFTFDHEEGAADHAGQL